LELLIYEYELYSKWVIEKNDKLDNIEIWEKYKETAEEINRRVYPSIKIILKSQEEPENLIKTLLK